MQKLSCFFIPVSLTTAHPAGVQERYSLIAPAESSVLASVNMKIETFGNLVHHALKKVKYMTIFINEH